jgi:phosphoglycerate dehydrogenase-like enzyme
MTKIVCVQPLQLFPDQQARLEKLGEVTYYNERTNSPDEWLERTKGQDVVLTGVFGITTKWQDLHDVFVSLPFVGVGWADPKVLREHNVTISNSPGCNKHAVTEWIIGMLLMMTRELDKYLNIKEMPFNKMPPAGFGWPGKEITILGKGNIGTCVGEAAEALGMKVTFFKRGDDLIEKIKNADVVVDTLSSKPKTQGLLDKTFFDSLKGGVYFVTVSAGEVLDVDAMLAALDSGKLRLAAHDSFMAGDTSNELYQKILKHPKVYATPHIAYNTDVTDRTGNDMMIDNVEAWIKGKPINVVGSD